MPIRRKDTPGRNEEPPARSPAYGLLNRSDNTNFQRNEGPQTPGLFGSMRHRIRMASEWRLPLINKATDALTPSPNYDPTSRFRRLSSSLRRRAPENPVHPSAAITKKVSSTVRGPPSRTPHVEVPRESRRSISGPGALPTETKPDTTPTQLGEPSSSSPPRLETNTGLDFGLSMMGGNWSIPEMAITHPDPPTPERNSHAPILRDTLARLPVRIKQPPKPEQTSFSKEVSPSTHAENTPSKPQGRTVSGEDPGEEEKESDIMTNRVPVTWLDRVLETSSDLRGSSPQRHREQRLDWLLRTLESRKYRDQQLEVSPTFSKLPCLAGDPFGHPRLLPDSELEELARIMNALKPQHRRSTESRLLRILGYLLYFQFLESYPMNDGDRKAQTSTIPHPGLSRDSEVGLEADSPSSCKVKAPLNKAEVGAYSFCRNEGGALPWLNPLTLLNNTNEQRQLETPSDPPSPTQLRYIPPPPEEDEDLMLASRIGGYTYNAKHLGDVGKGQPGKSLGAGAV